MSSFESRATNNEIEMIHALKAHLVLLNMREKALLARPHDDDDDHVHWPNDSCLAYTQREKNKIEMQLRQWASQTPYNALYIEIGDVLPPNGPQTMRKIDTSLPVDTRCMLLLQLTWACLQAVPQFMVRDRDKVVLAYSMDMNGEVHLQIPKALELLFITRRTKDKSNSTMQQMLCAICQCIEKLNQRFISVPGNEVNDILDHMRENSITDSVADQVFTFRKLVDTLPNVAHAYFEERTGPIGITYSQWKYWRKRLHLVLNRFESGQ